MVNQEQSVYWNNNISLFGVNLESCPIIEDISIIIPTLGRDILEVCLYWIIKSNAWPGCLIIVNQGDFNKVEVWLRQVKSHDLQVKHIKSNKTGRSAGINCGLRNVNTKYFAITDDDCFVDSNWLVNIRSVLEKNPQSIITGRVESTADKVSMVVTSLRKVVYQKPRIKYDSMSGGNMATSVQVIKKVGLFDEDRCMQTAEDAEWSYRALRKKVSIIYDPSICILHHDWRDTAKKAEQYRQYALSHGGFYGKYLRKGDLFIFFRLILHLIRASRRWIKGRISGKDDLAMIGKSYTIYLLPGTWAGIKSSNKTNA